MSDVDIVAWLERRYRSVPRWAMPGGLYDVDALAWAEEQAILLRRLASGERVNGAIDWPHVIEEIDEVGQSALRAVRSLLRQAMTHLLKRRAWPASSSVVAWRGEAQAFLDDAADAFTPSMRQKVDLEAIYAKARRAALAAEDASGPALTVPERCPFTLDALLAGDLDALGA